MNKFIKLHYKLNDEHGNSTTRPVWFNVNHIVKMKQATYNNLTAMHTSDGVYLEVVETPEEVINLIHKANG